MAPRWRRNFWKYRNHAKAYRALLLDAGHLSQSFGILGDFAHHPARPDFSLFETAMKKLYRYFFRGLITILPLFLLWSARKSFAGLLN